MEHQNHPLSNREDSPRFVAFDDAGGHIISTHLHERGHCFQTVVYAVGKGDLLTVRQYRSRETSLQQHATLLQIIRLELPIPGPCYVPDR